MWYWMMRLQGLLGMAPYRVYYKLRGISFSSRCKECGGWISEYYYLRTGVCRNCEREKIRLDPANYYVASDERYQLHEEEYKKQLPEKGASDLYYNRIAKKVRSGKVLDAGCGTGYLLRRLHDHSSSDLYGVDLGIGALQIAKVWVPDANFCLTNIMNIPFKANSFDCVICAAVLEHVDEKQGNAVVRECYRVLKPGGTGLFLVPTGKGVGDTINPEHIQSFTYDGLLNLLGDAGFEIIDGQKFGLYLPLVSPFLELLLRISGRRLPISTVFDIEVPQLFAAELLAECCKPKA